MERTAYTNQKSGSIFSNLLRFFIRKFKRKERPLGDGATFPVDGVYRFFEMVRKDDSFAVNDRSFSLSTLLNNEALTEMYESASMVIASCNASCSFYFPFDCTPGKVWPLDDALSVTFIHSSEYGRVALFEIGATQTFEPVKPYKKGDEKGYFVRENSAIILLFEKDKIVFEKDLGKGHMGETFGKPRKINPFVMAGQ
jgi:phosphatidylserine decarboxylase